MKKKTEKKPKVVKKAEKPKVEKPKKVEVEKPKKVRVHRSVGKDSVASVDTSSTAVEKKELTYGGMKIIRVLSDKAPKGFVLCEAMDGNTKVKIHVPKELVI